MQNEQTPAAGPLTAESVKLLKRGDWLLGPDGRAHQLDEWGDGGFLTFLNNEQDGYLATLCTFLGRPDHDGWIAWHGGENPMPGVKIDWRNKVGVGGTWLSDEVAGFGKPLNGNHRIIAYRPHVASPASSSSVAQGDAGGVGQWSDLSCGEQFALATKIAANVGYVLTPEPDHPDCPHSRPQPSGETREASSDQPEQGGGMEVVVADKLARAFRSNIFDHPHKQVSEESERTIELFATVAAEALSAEPAEVRVREQAAEIVQLRKNAEGYKLAAEIHAASATAAEAQLARMRAALEKTRDPLSTAKMWAKRKGGCEGAIDKIDRALFSVKQALRQAGEVG